jgi:hypothetical protein
MMTSPELILWGSLEAHHGCKVTLAWATMSSEFLPSALMEKRECLCSLCEFRGAYSIWGNVLWRSNRPKGVLAFLGLGFDGDLSEERPSVQKPCGLCFLCSFSCDQLVLWLKLLHRHEGGREKITPVLHGVGGIAGGLWLYLVFGSLLLLA